MVYRDKDKQREANKEAMRRYREAEKRRKGITSKGITREITGSTKRYRDRQKGATIKECSAQDDTAPKVARLIMVDESKRGLDIKTFEDLPPDVQQTIESMSKDTEDKVKRIARAIHYQHLFPDRYHSTGLI